MFMDLADTASNCETRQVWVNGDIQYSTQVIRLSRSQQKTKINKRFMDLHNVWCKVVLGFCDITTETRARMLSYI